MYAALLSLTNNNAHAQTVCSYIIGLSIFVSSCSASYQSGHKRYTLLGSFYVDPYGSKVLRIPANAYMPPVAACLQGALAYASCMCTAHRDSTTPTILPRYTSARRIRPTDGTSPRPTRRSTTSPPPSRSARQSRRP